MDDLVTAKVLQSYSPVSTETSCSSKKSLHLIDVEVSTDQFQINRLYDRAI
jgi:hypothetical protein